MQHQRALTIGSSHSSRQLLPPSGFQSAGIGFRHPNSRWLSVLGRPIIGISLNPANTLFNMLIRRSIGMPCASWRHLRGVAGSDHGTQREMTVYRPPPSGSACFDNFLYHFENRLRRWRKYPARLFEKRKLLYMNDKLCVDFPKRAIITF